MAVVPPPLAVWSSVTSEYPKARELRGVPVAAAAVRSSLMGDRETSLVVVGLSFWGVTVRTTVFVSSRGPPEPVLPRSLTDTVSMSLPW